MSRQGPLTGVRVVEFAGLGPAPFCAMLLADMGADVLRIDRPGAGAHRADLIHRGRRSLALDLKEAAGIETCLAVMDKADVLIEGFRPGVMERLGLGPDCLLGRIPRLIYGRLTGWGQQGPLAQAAGHDINYIALTGALAAIGEPGGPPTPPLNLVGDFAGGSLYLAFGIAAALFERSRSGLGQVIDAAIVDGTASMMTFFQGLVAMGMSGMARGQGLLSGGAPFYACFACADGKHVSVGSLEPQFFALLTEGLGLSAEDFADRHNPASWVRHKATIAAAFRTKTRDEWTAIFEGTDACFAPVLTLEEAHGHAHMRERGVYIERDGLMQAAAAPRLSRTPGQVGSAPVRAGTGGEDALREWGVFPA